MNSGKWFEAMSATDRSIFAILANFVKFAFASWALLEPQALSILHLVLTFFSDPALDTNDFLTAFTQL